MSSTGSPVMLPPEGRRLIAGGAVHARLLVVHDHRSYASTFEMTVAAGFDVGAQVHGNGEGMFYVIDGQLDVLGFEPADRSLPDWHAWTSASGETFLHGLPGSFLYVPPGVPHAFANRTDRPVTLFFQSSPAGTRTTSPSSALCWAPPRPGTALAVLHHRRIPGG